MSYPKFERELYMKYAFGGVDLVTVLENVVEFLKASRANVDTIDLSYPSENSVYVELYVWKGE